MAIIEEGKYGFVIVAYSNRLCRFAYQASLRKKKNCGWKGTHHIHINDASFPVPDQQSVVKHLVILGYHAEKVAAYFMFAIPQSRTSGLFYINPSAGGKGVSLTSRQLAKKYSVCPVSRYL